MKEAGALTDAPPALVPADWSREAREPVAAGAVPVVTGLRRKLLRLGIWRRLALHAWRLYGRPRVGLEALRLLARARQAAAGGLPPRKYVLVGGRAFFSLRAPGCPSPAFDRYAALELNRVMPFRPDRGLQTAILAITKRCGLGCAHCSEWDTLRQPDTLSVGDLLEIVARLRAAGAPQILISGGEPLLRVDAVEAICRSARDACDLWVLTSGAPLTAEVARRLRAAGVTGVVVSLDHWDPAEHDAFRGIPGTFGRTVIGTRHAAAAGLVVALSLTATRGFVSADNLERYAALAQRLGAGFIQVLEPRDVGRWAGADVALTDEQVALLEAFDHSMNQERPEMPLVDYPGLGQRRDGCWGAGDRYLFVDADGGVHACPFCRGAVGSCLVESLGELRGRLRARGCHAYGPADGDAPAVGRGSGAGRPAAT